jgi:hypothetical protein
VIRFLVRTLIGLVSNTVGLLVAAIVLDDTEITASGFVVAVLIFTLVYALMLPFLASRFRGSNAAALGGVALIATLVALIVTALATDGLSISGIDWLLAPVIVWAVSLLTAFILPYLGLKKYLEQR